VAQIVVPEFKAQSAQKKKKKKEEEEEATPETWSSLLG
jgi:hypothetical protein